MSIILMSWKMGGKKNCFYLSLFDLLPLNLTLWQFNQMIRQHVLLLYSLHAIISFLHLFIVSLSTFHICLQLYLILQLFNPPPEQGILSLCVSQPLLDVFVGCDQGEVRCDRLIPGTHRYRTLASCGVGRLMFKDANVIFHCQGLHSCIGLLCSR